MINAGLTTAARIDFEKAFLPLSSRITLGCSDCHGGKIYNEWEGSAHAQGVSNVRFLTVYNGTDVTGNMSPATRFATHRDYGRFPLPPDPEQPYFGPGFKLDFPNQPGNCATCHAPTAALEREAGADINEISGIDGMGVHCDFCHKIIDVEVSSITGLPLKNMPGIQSIELRRPFDGRQLFFGPYDDVDIGPDTYLPLQGESRLCSSCHNASFWDTPIYESYREWLESPYPSEGQTCQSCHMKPDGKSANFAPGRGGMDRDPNQVFSHNFPGASDVEFLQDTAIMQLDARRNGGRIVVDVRVTNENAGHHIPTDHPMRNILLVVSAETIDGQALELAEGSLVPVWGGVGTEPDDYAGRPGKGFAKILEERWTGVAPAVAYWNPTVIKEDTRIPARNSDRSNYVFVESGLNPVEVTAELIFRRAFKDLADIKGWNDPDISMELAKVVLE
jgi:hypothetical protein